MNNSLCKMLRQNLLLLTGLLTVLVLNTNIKAAPLTPSPLAETNLEDIRITHTFTSPAMVFGTVDRGESKLNTFYVLTTESSGWKKNAFSCVRAAARSSDSKHVWVVSQIIADNMCVHSYQISHSADTGKTWKTSNAFHPSGAYPVISFGLTRQGTGQVVIGGERGDEEPMIYYSYAFTKFGEQIIDSPQSGHTTSGWTLPNLAATVFTDFSGDLSRGDEARRRKIFANVQNPGPQ